MVKLLYSSDFDPAADVCMRVADKDRAFTKSASSIFGMDYSDMKPDDNHVGIHVVALGDAEHYPANRNGDLFNKKACEKYHDTFVKHGHVYRHHRNKDPKKSIGKIAASAYNPRMGRIELYIHVDKEKGAPELARLEKEGESAHSMACRVSEDRCSICNNLRKQAGDSSECSHVRDHLGELWEDGRKVATYNDEPDFFDISFVGRPADRIAWSLKTASAEYPVEDSARRAIAEGLEDEPELSESGIRKRALAERVSHWQDVLKSLRGVKSASPANPEARFALAMSKAASVELDDSTIDGLRKLSPKVAFAVLADAGILMDMGTFYRYATGTGMPNDLKKAAESLIGDEISSGTAYADDSFDTDTAFAASAPINTRTKVARASMGGPRMAAVLGSGDSAIGIDDIAEVCSNSIAARRIAEKYAAYELSTLDASLHNGRRHRDTEGMTAFAAVQNLRTRN